MGKVKDVATIRCLFGKQKMIAKRLISADLKATYGPSTDVTSALKLNKIEIIPKIGRLAVNDGN